MICLNRFVRVYKYRSNDEKCVIENVIWMWNIAFVITYGHINYITICYDIEFRDPKKGWQK